MPFSFCVACIFFLFLPFLLLQSDEDDEPVCQKPMIEEHCKKHHCEAAEAAYNACVQRVQAKGEGHCEGYAFDLWHCIDHCVSTSFHVDGISCS